MLKYLIILLDDSSVPFCHYSAKEKRKLISTENLKKAVRFAMLENLNVQFVWPYYELSDEYRDIISSIDHSNIVPVSLTDDADIIVAQPKDFNLCGEGATVVATIKLQDMLEKPQSLFPILKKVSRLNVVITDPENFHDADIEAYRNALTTLSERILEEFKSGHNIQVNILTDRMALTGMNNCNAGWESLTLAASVGSFEKGIDIKNPQLFRLDHAPICRKCDAWHCRRCVWLNKRCTLEVNVPGHEQCVMAHIERETTRRLSETIRKHYGRIQGEEIMELDYIDPFDKIINNES